MTPSRDFTLVFFDLGGVVCRFRPERRLAVLSAACGKSQNEVHRLLWESGFSMRCDRGDFSDSEMHERACALLDWSASHSTFRRAWASAFEPDPAVLSIVDDVRRLRRTGLLTDNPPILKEALAHELCEVGSRFDFVVFSFALQSVKPSERFFRAALAEVRRAPDEVLFIDDVRANVGAAARVGMVTVQFTTATALRAELVRAGVLAPTETS